MKHIGKLSLIEPVNDGKEDRSMHRQRTEENSLFLVLLFLYINQLKVKCYSTGLLDRVPIHKQSPECTLPDFLTICM